MSAQRRVGARLDPNSAFRRHTRLAGGDGDKRLDKSSRLNPAIEAIHEAPVRLRIKERHNELIKITQVIALSNARLPEGVIGGSTSMTWCVHAQVKPAAQSVEKAHWSYSMTESKSYGP